MSNLWRITKYATIAALGGSTVHVLNQNDWDVQNIGAVRFGRAALTVGRIAVDYKMSVSGRHNDGSPESLAVWSETHKRAANRLLWLCCQNGGVFIKVGQHIGALEYLVPHEYVSTLKVLHSRAPRSSIDDIKRVIHADTGQTTDELFAEFDEEPIGTASLAQVHKARLHDGRLVAVKVQHPRVKQHSYIDMTTMDILVKLVDKIFPEFSFQWLAEETRRNLPLELDFINEGRNAERIARTFAQCSWLKVPAIDWTISSKRLLTMEYLDGCEVTNKKYMIDNGIDCRQVSHRLGLMYSQMIFIEGYVHCDPHPGNILVNKLKDGSPQIVLLDHGLYTQLTEKFRHEYSRMWLAVINSDVNEMKVWGEALGVGKLFPLLACIMTAKPWNVIQRGLDKTVDKETQKKESRELREYASQYISQISELLSKVDRQILLVFKTNDLLRSIDYALGTGGERRSLLTMSRCCVRAVYDQQYRQSHHWWQQLSLILRFHWIETKLSCYSLYLWLTVLIWGQQYQ
ncbi:aarF domain-containing protein kinase 1-like [Oppia nitens]|uniref:aarF domain-containing protein kinase 1-like n=1 Tax=Oppia nitens TaxID=1686743 RepID=UPI0023D9A23A|nr:aarF domain-containing protein kinase 1-like [Oppia nitens]